MRSRFSGQSSLEESERYSVLVREGARVAEAQTAGHGQS